MLGDVCTRTCGFCDIQRGKPSPLDWLEPERVAQAVKAMNLKHTVIPSVNRDDRRDGGAPIFAMVIRRIRQVHPGCSIEALIPDFKGSLEALRIVMEAQPEILNHNLRQLGFDYVFDTNFGADLTIMEEATEFLARLKNQKGLPLFTACCPGWINWVELNRPDLLPHLSTTKSPQQMHGAVTKRGSFARALGAEFAAGKTEPYVVSVMPCTAKKDEAVRAGVSGDIDHVLTTRELARMIRARGIAFSALPEKGEFDNPLGESTGAGQLFGASGGVMEAVVRTAAHFIGAENSLPLEWHQLRGVSEGLKTAEIPGRIP